MLVPAPFVFPKVNPQIRLPPPVGVIYTVAHGAAVTSGSFELVAKAPAVVIDVTILAVKGLACAGFGEVDAIVRNSHDDGVGV